MQEFPDGPSIPQPAESLSFAGLLQDLLQDWDTAPDEESEEFTLNEAESAPLSAELLLSRLEESTLTETSSPAAADPIWAPTTPRLAMPQGPAPEFEIEALLKLDGAARDDGTIEEAAEEPLTAAPAAPAGDGSLGDLLGSIEREIEASAPVAASAKCDAGRALERFITFALAGSLYALELKHVLETDRIPRSTMVPGTPAFLRGITNLRGEVLALVDLRQLLDLGPTDQPGAERMLVVKTQNSDGACGLIVDRLGGMALMDRGEFEPAPPGDEKVAPLLAGIGEHRGRLVGVLDLEKLFASGDIRALAGM